MNRHRRIQFGFLANFTLIFVISDKNKLKTGNFIPRFFGLDNEKFDSNLWQPKGAVFFNPWEGVEQKKGGGLKKNGI